MSANVIPSTDPPSPFTGSPPAPPERLGEYLLLREIGRGGMGVVYEAVQESLGRHVALKVLPAGLAVRGAFLERFRREARIAAHLHHTNIVAVHGIGEQDGAVYYAMQFIQGHGLDAVLQDVRRLRGMGTAAGVPLTDVRGAMPPPSGADAGGPAPRGREELVGAPGPPYYRGVARLGLQAAEALAYAHEQGVLHRDVKPANLLIDLHGALWVTDFGLAKADDDADLTAADDPVGTLRYMAPERFRGRSEARGDVYALGATLYEMLTLRPAFDEADRATLVARIMQQAPPPPRQEAPDLPRDLETIVVKAMAREPADRYATAADMAEDLRRFLEDRPIRARRLTTLERLRRWRRRSPAVAGLTMATAGLLLALAVGSTVAAVQLAWQGEQLGRVNGQLRAVNNRLESANGQLTEAGDRLQDDKKSLEKLDADKTDKLWHSRYQAARAGRFSARPGRRFDSLKTLAEALPIRFDELLRTEAVACLTLTDAKPIREWAGWPAGSYAVDFDAALDRYARSDSRGGVSVRRTDDDTEAVRLDTGFDAPSWVELSADGRFVAVRPDGAAGRLQIWDLSKKPEKRIEEESGVVAVALSPAGPRAAAVFSSGEIAVYDLETGQSVRRLKTGPGAAAFRPDGKSLAVGGGQSVAFYDPEKGDCIAEWPTPARKTQGTEYLAWSPDGAMLAAVGRDRRTHIWNAASQQLTATLAAPLGNHPRIAFSPGGDLLASGDATEMLRLWDPRTGRELFSTPAETPALRFGSDGRLAGDVDRGRLRIWEVASGREYRTLIADASSAAPPEFSGGAAIARDGRLLAAAMSDGVRLWDLNGGAACGFIPTGPAAAVAFDASGALLTCGTAPESAVLRWPVVAAADHPEELHIGPSARLPLHGVGLACSRDGRVTAAATLRGVQVLHPDRPDEPIDLHDHDDNRDDVRDVALSPDGRWVAACSHAGKGVRVWEVLTGAAAPPIPVDGPASAVFSPDGTWLASGGKEKCQLWKVGSWEQGPEVDGAASAFSPGGATLAVETGRGVMRLIDPITGKMIVQLEDPNQDRSDVYFTPDGGRLAAVSLEGRCVHVWDLSLIRQELTGIGLDWDRPPLESAPPAGKPLRVTMAP